MSLFVINRYDESVDDGDELQSKARLEKLKGKIEERKKARIQSTIENINDEETHFKIENIDETPVVKEQENNLQNENINLNVDMTQFKVIGTKEFEKTQKVKRILPHWLANPTPIAIDLKQQDVSIENLEILDNTLKKKLMQDGFKYLFPVQAQVIPWLIEENKKSSTFWPRDLCVSAPTGSGKTLTYVLPIIQMLSSRVERQIRALVILPVKELAAQVAKVFKDYCVGSNLKVTLLTGAMSLVQEQLHVVKYSDAFGWQSEADIVVCTAGRLVEHLRFTEGFSLKHLQYIVMDEADRIMDHIQNDWLHHLNRHLQSEEMGIIKNISMVNSKTLSTLHRPPQKLLFSATLSQDPEKLKQWNLFQPKLFSVGQNKTNKCEQLEKFTTPLELSEKYTICSSENKPLVLYEILRKEKSKRVLCFTNSSQAAHRLTVLLSYLLKDGISVAELSASGLNKNSRDSVLKDLLSGKINVLVSTDALARGIDIPNCELVISYEPPRNAKTYIHRVGRTGRAGNFGKAITILLYNQTKSFQDVMKTMGKQDIEKFDVQQDQLEEYSEEYKIAMDLFTEKLNHESQTHNHHVKVLKRGKPTKSMPNKCFKK